jgi:glutamate/tyrosine decarboxylase-like PLP-dependent enzyme
MTDRDQAIPVGVAAPAPQTRSHPLWPSAATWESTLAAAHGIALEYLATLPDRPVSRHATPQDLALRFDLPLPDRGCAAEDAVREWFERAEPGIVASSGPRYFGFVVGGSTPAALAGDWLAAALDQNAGSWLMSPAAAQTELSAVGWLRELFGLPPDWTGAFTTGATMANLCGLAAARQWASRCLGFDAARDGLGGQPAIPVVASDVIHQSDVKALAMLGLGRAALHAVPSHDGAIDLVGFERTLAAIDGPAIVIAAAGEVNTGAFDPIRAMAERCAAHTRGAWLHVDAAFGLYAALSPGHAHLLDGIERANSVASDAHKWLNVPYDCGFVFVRDPGYLRDAFSASAAYLNLDDEPRTWNALEHVPDDSRRFRALAVWCALRAAGRAGYQEIVARSLANATRFAGWVASHPSLELLAPARLNVVCFRALASAGSTEDDAFNAQMVEAIQRGGIAYVTATRWDGKAGMRAAFDNWATTAPDVLALQSAVQKALQTEMG